MPSIEELQLLNHILENGDWSSIDKMALMKNIFLYIKIFLITLKILKITKTTSNNRNRNEYI